MSNKLEIYKKLINFSGIAATETKVICSFDGSDNVIIASRLGDMGPWQAVVAHDLEEITTPIVEDLVASKMISSSECKQLLEKPITDALIKEIKPVVSQIIEDSKEILRELESQPIIKVHNEERTRKIESLLTGRIKPVLRAPIMEHLTQEEETLKKLERLLENDYPALFNTTKKYVSILLGLLKKYEADPAARSAIGEDKIAMFRENCVTFRDGLTFRQVRGLKPEPLEDNINKVMFVQRYSDVDQMVSKLNA